MSYLPFELIVEILHKTPAESLLRLKSTCKRWYDLISDKEFIYNHFDHSPERFIRAGDDDHAVQNFDLVTRIHSVSPMPSEFRLQHPIYKMVHCDGLMLCVCTGFKYERTRFTKTNDWKLAIWNPVLRTIKWIEPRIRICVYDHFGIGYDKKSRDNYKILSIPWRRFLQDDVDDDDDDAKCKIYESMKSDPWRNVDGTFDGVLCREGVSVKGNMYWIVMRNVLSYFIISFDFSTETFKDVCVCPTKWNLHLECFNRDGLALLQRLQPREIHVWVTNKLSDEIVSFTKYFNVVLPTFQPGYNMDRPAYSIVKHGKIVLWCEVTQEDDKWSTSITLSEIHEGGVRNNSETGRFDATYHCDWLARSCVYVPSLIPVPR